MSEGRTLVPGDARGAALVLEEPLSFWGGVDPETGSVVDVRHPQRGANVTGRILVLPSGRGSSSSSSVLAESIRAGTAPAAIVLGEPDPILALGAIVARELYGTRMPVVVLEDPGLTTGDVLMLRADEVDVRILR
jgi:predicted aconitase with swiveling domain